MSSSSTSEAIVRAFYTDLWERADYASLPALLHEDATFQGTFGQVMRGHDAFAAYVRSVREAFGDYRCEVREILVDGERVAARIGFSGRHDAGPFLDVQPSGRMLSWEGVGFFTLEAGRIRHLWVMGDMLGLMAQLRR